MATVTVTTYVPGPLTAAALNSNFTTIVTAMNGQLDRDNIKTKWAEMAVSLRADVQGAKSYTLTINMPTRAAAPVRAKVLGFSYDFIDASGANSLTATIKSGATTIGSAAIATNSNGYQALGGTTEVSPTAQLTAVISATNNFAAGDYLNLTIYLATELMDDAEVIS